MNKKAISFLLIICMLLSFMPAAAFAAESTGSVATVNDVGCGTWNDVVQAITTDSPVDFDIKLKDKITTNQALNITSGQAVTLNLNDTALTSDTDADDSFIINEGTLTIKADTNGTITTTGQAVTLITNKKNATLNINGGSFNGKIVNPSDATLNISGGRFAVIPENATILDDKEFTTVKDKDGYYTLKDKEKPPVDPEEPVIPDVPVVPNVPDKPFVDVPTGIENAEEVRAAVETMDTEDNESLINAAKNVKITDAEKEAAIKALEDNGISTDKEVKVVAVPRFEIKVVNYTTASGLTLNINPQCVLKATTDPNGMDPDKTAEFGTKSLDLGTETDITFTIELPKGFTANFVKHEKGAEDNNAIYYYPVKDTEVEGVVSFTIKHGFSDFTFLNDSRKATIEFDQDVETMTYTPENIGVTLPEPKNNTRFKGWKIEGTIYTELTEELLNMISEMNDQTVKATAQYSSSSGGSGGGSSSSSGGPAASKAVVSSPDNDVKVTYTGVASSLINNVEKAVADNKNVQVVGGSNSAIKVSAKKDGTVLNSFDDPLTVTVPVIKSAVSSITSTSKLTLAKVNKAADGKISFTYMGGNYNETKNNFTAYVDEPGEYVLLFDDNVQKIALQVGKKANTVNGRTVTNDVAPVIVNSRTMIPLRFVSESLGGQVSWTEATRAVTIKMNGLTMNMTIDQKIDGFDAAPVIRDGRTMVPVRYIAEKLGANVIYVPNTQEIVVVK